MTTKTKNILKGLHRLKKDVEFQKASENITDTLKASIFYEEHKNTPQFKDKINELKSKFGKLGFDSNGLVPVHPVSENADKTELFKEVAAEFGHEFKAMSFLNRIGTVIITINKESVTFAGLRNVATVKTYSITKEQIRQALTETL